MERTLSENADAAVVLSADGLSLAEMTAVEMLIPPAARSRVTTAYRALSGGLPVTLNALAAEASQRKVNFALDGSANLSGSPFATYLSQTQLVTTGVLPLAEALGYSAFGGAAPVAKAASAPARPAPASAPSATIRRPPYATIGAAVAALLLVGIGAVVYFRNSAKPSPAPVADNGNPPPATSPLTDPTTSPSSKPEKVKHTKPAAATSQATSAPAATTAPTSRPAEKDGQEEKPVP
jgi:hypothetical protein